MDRTRYCTVDLVHSLNLPYEFPAFDTVEIEFIDVSSSGQFRPREVAQRVEKEIVDTC